MNSIYDPQAVRDLERRIRALPSLARSEWGDISVAQMLAQCVHALEMAMDQTAAPKPVGTMPGPARVAIGGTLDFIEQRDHLLALLDRFSVEGNVEATHRERSFVGPLTATRSGELTYSFVDDCLRQFGA